MNENRGNTEGVNKEIENINNSINAVVSAIMNDTTLDKEKRTLWLNDFGAQLLGASGSIIDFSNGRRTSIDHLGFYGRTNN
jgi:hypothetical protein